MRCGESVMRILVRSSSFGALAGAKRTLRCSGGYLVRSQALVALSSQPPSVQISDSARSRQWRKALDPQKRRFSFRIRLKHVTYTSTYIHTCIHTKRPPDQLMRGCRCEYRYMHIDRREKETTGDGRFQKTLQGRLPKNTTNRPESVLERT